MNKILITGSEGLIGKKISNYLKKKNRVSLLDIKKNINLCDENDDFDFNQDIDYESEIKSPGWLRYQKRIKS